MCSDDQPHRRAWHRAALLSGEHEDVAVELEEAGAWARRRGAVPVAVTAMRRAAELGEPASRSRRLLAAAGLAVEIGRARSRGAAAGRGQPVGPRRAGPRTGHMGRGDRVDTPARRRAVQVPDRRGRTSRSGRRPRPARRSSLAGRLTRLVGRSGSRGEAGADRRLPSSGRCECRRPARIRGPRVCGSDGSRGRGTHPLEARGRPTRDSTPMPLASSGLPRSSLACSTWAPISLQGGSRRTADGRKTPASAAAADALRDAWPPVSAIGTWR